VLHTDDFASWDEPLGWWPRLVAEALEPLARGEPARFRRTDWESTGVERWGEIPPAEVVILEGVGASRPELRRFLAYSIWVETPRELRLRRGLERDGEDARGRWEQWMAEEDGYIAEAGPAEAADAIVPGDRGLW
jgi:uridine kinase